MIPFEVVVQIGGEYKDGIAVELSREHDLIAVVVGERLRWFDRTAVDFGAPYPVDVRAL